MDKTFGKIGHRVVKRTPKPRYKTKISSAKHIKKLSKAKWNEGNLYGWNKTREKRVERKQDTMNKNQRKIKRKPIYK